MPVLQVNSYSIDQKSGEIWTGQANLQPISFKSDRLLEMGEWMGSAMRTNWFKGTSKNSEFAQMQGAEEG